MTRDVKDYLDGTSAKKIEYDVYEENEVLKRKKIQKKNNKIKTKVVLYVFAIFALSFIVMTRYTCITELNYNIDKAYRDYENMVNENSKIKIAIEREVDLQSVKGIAEEKLGMHKPDKYQVVYMSVPKSDFTQVADVYMNNKNTGNNMFAILADKFSKFSHLIE